MVINSHNIISAGRQLEEARKVLIMLHGRGDNAKSFISLSENLKFNRSEFSVLALQANGNTWYPYSFLAPIQENEPKLSQSLSGLSGLVEHLKDLRFGMNDIYFLGFSQGACFALEFCARHAMLYGGIIAFTGGLLGEQIDFKRYRGNFLGAPIFMGASDFDPHVPEVRINESEEILSRLGGNVTKKIYCNMGHTINEDELLEASKILGYD